MSALAAGAVAILTAWATSPACAAAALPIPVRCSAAPGVDREIAVRKDPTPRPVIDPVYRQSYTADMEGLVFENGDWQRRFDVYYQEGGQTVAATAADLLSRFYCYGQVRLAASGAFLDPTRGGDNPEAADDSRAPVNRFFISNSGTAGGAEGDGVLYLLDARRKRHPLELAREIAHEYSHLTIPGIRGFDGSRGSEDWANGYLGEVLYLQWLGEDGAQTELPAAEVLDWARARSLALVGAFLALGPGVLNSTSSHFWETEGLLLYFRETYGLPVLARILSFARNSTGADLAQKIADAMARSPSGTVTVAGELAAAAGDGRQWEAHRAGSACVLDPGMAARQYVYLPKGDYQLKITAHESRWQIRGASIGRGSTAVILGGFSEGAPQTRFASVAAGWYLLQWRNVGTSAVSVDSWTWTPAHR